LAFELPVFAMVAVTVAVVVVTVPGTEREIDFVAAVAGSANAASPIAIKKQSTLRMPFICISPRAVDRRPSEHCGEWSELVRRGLV
jgi:hypothetical protein